MNTGMSILLFLSSLAADPAAKEPDSASLASFASDPVWYQMGGYYDDGGYAGGGGTTAAQDRNMRVSFFFLAVPLQSSDVMDVPSGSSEPWTEYWSTGLGGGIDFAYQMAPGFRFGAGTGYHLFPGKEEDLGWATSSYGSIQCIPIRVEATVCFPFQLPSAAWFRTGRGFVQGPAPYVGVELAGVYRTAVDVEFSSGAASSDVEMFASSFAFFFGARLGFEFRGPTYGFFLDFGYRLYLPPKEGDDLSSSVDILNMTGFPIRIGVAVYFGAQTGPRY